jgi:hypothetical protein
MKYSLRFANGLAELTCEPSFTYEDGVKALTEVIEAPWRLDMRALLILDQGSAFSPTREGIQALVGLMDTILTNEKVLMAIVVAKVVHYGIGRVLEARVGGGTGRVRVFLKEEAARQWVATTARASAE